jgi:protein SCO1/2
MGVGVAGAVVLTGCSGGATAESSAGTSVPPVVIATLPASGEASDSSPASSSGQAVPPVGTTLDEALPADITSLPLRNQDGAVVTLASLAGKTVVVSPNLTLCQEFCPLISANLRVVDHDVDASGLGDQVEILEVTVDPQRDDQAHLKDYQKLFGVSPNWDFLTGTDAQITKFWDAFHLDYGRTELADGEHPTDWLTGKPLTYDVDHQNVVYVVGPDGHLKWLVDAAPYLDGAPVPNPLESFLNDEGRENASALPNPDWTSADVDAAVAYVTGTTVHAA